MKINLAKLRGNPEAVLLAVDLFMVLLVLFNLAWIVFNALFSAHLFQSGLAALSPSFTDWYRTEVHPNFADYDMVFVAIYVTELLLRWAIAIVRRTYHRWFFYPFIHWYDVLGCIPVGSFRWLRVLRVVVLLWRLQQQGIIDLRDSALYKTIRKYFDVLTEEVADRVVINVLDGVHGELERGNPVLHRIGHEVLAPRRPELVAWLTGRLQQTAGATWQEHHQALHAYLTRIITEGMDASAAVRRLGQMPVIGPTLTDTLDAAVADIATSILRQAALDLASPAYHEQLAGTVDLAVTAVVTDDARLARLLREVLLESLTIVKQQVEVQEWKLREARGHYD